MCGAAPVRAGRRSVLVFGTLFLVVVINAFVYALYKFHLNTMVWYVLIQGAALQTLSFSIADVGRCRRDRVAIYLAQSGTRVVLVRAKPLHSAALRRYALGYRRAWRNDAVLNAYADATAQRPLLMAVRTIPWAQPLTAKSFLRLASGSRSRNRKVAGSFAANVAAYSTTRSRRCSARPAQNRTS